MSSIWKKLFHRDEEEKQQQHNRNEFYAPIGDDSLIDPTGTPDLIKYDNLMTNLGSASKDPLPFGQLFRPDNFVFDEGYLFYPRLSRRAGIRTEEAMDMGGGEYTDAESPWSGRHTAWRGDECGDDIDCIKGLYCKKGICTEEEQFSGGFIGYTAGKKEVIRGAHTAWLGDECGDDIDCIKGLYCKKGICTAPVMPGGEELFVGGGYGGFVGGAAESRGGAGGADLRRL